MVTHRAVEGYTTATRGNTSGAYERRQEKKKPFPFPSGLCTVDNSRLIHRFCLVFSSR